jgi:hypothetical protein
MLSLASRTRYESPDFVDGKDAGLFIFPFIASFGWT